MISKILYKRNIMPEYVTFFVTNRCNLKCKHCFFWKELNNTKNELTLDEIKKLSKSMGKFTVLTLTGGEPFLRENIFEIIKTFYVNNKIRYLVLPTNGTIFIKKLIKRVIEEFPKLKVRVMISIDEIQERHDKNRNKYGTFNTAINNFNELKEIKNENLKIGTITTFSKLNESRIFYIYDWIKKNLNPDFMNFPIIRGDVQDKSIKNIDINIYERLVKKLNNEQEKTIIQSAKGLMNELNIRILKEKKFIIPCYAGIINAVIYSNGDIYPCELLNEKIANIKEFDFDFKKLWLSDKAKKIRKLIKDKKCFCVHGCNMLPNIIFNLNFTFRILRRWKTNFKKKKQFKYN